MVELSSNPVGSVNPVRDFGPREPETDPISPPEKAKAAKGNSPRPVLHL
jgi:hypothetical protein